MKIALIQMNLTWCETAANLRRAEELIANAPGADIYVLPEMFTTGFCMEPKYIAEPMEGPSLAWMQSMATKKNAAIVGSVAAISPEGGYRNRMYFVEPNGKVTYYDKRHLFSYSGEDKHYESGKEKVIVEFRGVRFFLQVCYDLRFPVFGRNCDDYDIALYVANWPDKRRMAWDILLRARAIENQAVVIGVNRVGNDPICNYDGGTVAIDFFGFVAAQCKDNTEQAITYEVKMDDLRQYRSKFPSLNDSDDFKILEK
jgi:predicted amidohydrolase